MRAHDLAHEAQADPNLGPRCRRHRIERVAQQIDQHLLEQIGVASAIVALVIAWLTVGVIAARAASAKPIRALRYE